MNSTVSAQLTESFRGDGVVFLPGVFADWIETLARGAEVNIVSPGPRAIFHESAQNGGRFIEDFCNVERIPEYREFVMESPLAKIAAMLMQSDTVQFFHDHYLHKEAMSPLPTPWHQDLPYYCVDGLQTVSFWIPLNSVPLEASLKCIAGSHLWPGLIRPTGWSSNDSFYTDDAGFADMPVICDDDHRIRSWKIEPGDAVAFNYRTVHGADANHSSRPRSTLSFRVLGDDVRFVARPGPTSPNYPQIGQDNGDLLRKDWFPMLIGH